jgi:DNA-directed RNA polymerase specialized sigma24 family protein
MLPAAARPFQVLALEESRQARGRVEALPEEQRVVIELAYFGTVKSRARLALPKLRQTGSSLTVVRR